MRRLKLNVDITLLVFFVASCISLTFSGCRKDKNCSESNNSSIGADDSHNFGMNCMNCHVQGGEGEGCFNVAGSAMDSLFNSHLSGGSVKFYSQPNGGGQLKYSVPIDAKGNFYSTESMDLVGLYPAITGPAGTTQYMSTSVSTGSCNSCHGVTTLKIWGK